MRRRGAHTWRELKKHELAGAPPPATTTPVKWGLLPHRAGEKTEVAEGASA